MPLADKISQHVLHLLEQLLLRGDSQREGVPLKGRAPEISVDTKRWFEAQEITEGLRRRHGRQGVGEGGENFRERFRVLRSDR